MPIGAVDEDTLARIANDHARHVVGKCRPHAGAEIEKKAVTKYRFELVRLLNLAFYCYSLMLQGMRLAVPPTSCAPRGSSAAWERESRRGVSDAGAHSTLRAPAYRAARPASA